MKKTYVKPALTLESFVLNQSIADSCGTTNPDFGRPGFGTKETCAWIDSWGDAYWLDSMDVCTTKAGENVDIGGICYNNPNSGVTIFGS